MASGPPNPGLDEEALDFSGPLGRISLAATSSGTACRMCIYIYIYACVYMYTETYSHVHICE